jgi:hypothetical protein
LQSDDLHGEAILQFANDQSFKPPYMLEIDDYTSSDLASEGSPQVHVFQADIDRPAGEFARRSSSL